MAGGGIKVISYVHTKQALVDMDDLALDEKARATTAIMLKYMNLLYLGKAVFEVAGDTCL